MNSIRYDASFPFLLSGILMLPNVIFQMIPLFRNRNTSPLWSFINSLIFNCSYGFYFGSNNYYQPSNGVILFLIALILTYGSFFNFPTSFENNLFIYKEIMSKQINKEEFIKETCGNRALPPRIKIIVEAFHFERRGKRKHVKITTYRSKKYLKYYSWEEQGNSIRLNETDLLHSLHKVHYKLDESAKESLNQIRNYLYNLGLSKDKYSKVYTVFQTPGLKEHITGTLSDEKDCILLFYQTFLSRFFWFLFTLIGYQSLYESFWAQKGEKMALSLKKVISMQNKYRCFLNNFDHDAAKNTFRTNIGFYPLNDNLFYNIEQQKIITEPYYDLSYDINKI